MPALVRHILNFLLTFVIFGVLGYISYWSINAWTKVIDSGVENLVLPKFATGLIVLIALAIGIARYNIHLSGLLNPAENTTDDYWDFIPAIAKILFIMLFLWSIPALIIYWSVDPENTKKAIQVTSMFLGIFFGGIYYWVNEEEFESTADKVTYFSGVVLGPPTVVGFLL